MKNAYIEDIKTAFGLTTRELAGLLQINASQMSMAAGGHRPLPYFAQRALQTMGGVAATAAAATPKTAYTWQNINAEKQRRAMRKAELKMNRLLLKQEQLQVRLAQLERRCTALPRLLAHPSWQVNDTQLLTASVMLRQSQEQLQTAQLFAAMMQAQLEGLAAEVNYWRRTILADA
jgi:hypothetical protein